MVNLIGKVAIVTGGSRGIGRSIALELTKAGANVIINYNKNKEDALETLSLIKNLGDMDMYVRQMFQIMVVQKN